MNSNASIISTPSSVNVTFNVMLWETEAQYIPIAAIKQNKTSSFRFTIESNRKETTRLISTHHYRQSMPHRGCSLFLSASDQKPNPLSHNLILRPLLCACARILPSILRMYISADFFPRSIARYLLSSCLMQRSYNCGSTSIRRPFN